MAVIGKLVARIVIQGTHVFTHTRTHTAQTSDQNWSYVSTCPSGCTHEHTLKNKTYLHSYTHSHKCLTYHKITHTNTRGPQLSTTDNWSEAALTHISNTHILTPLWLHWPLTLGEGGCCLMVWVHSLCVRSFPARLVVRGWKGPHRLTSNWGTVGGPMIKISRNMSYNTAEFGRKTAFVVPDKINVHLLNLLILQS